MTVPPNAAGDTAAIMAALYIAIVVDPRISAAVWAFEHRWVKLVSGLGLFLPAPVLVFNVILLLGSITVAGSWAWVVLVVNVVAVASQLFYLLAAWNEANRGP